MSTTNDFTIEPEPPLAGAPGCKDTQVARRLIRQMRGDTDGRTCSNVERQAQSPVYAVPEEGEKWKEGAPFIQARHIEDNGYRSLEEYLRDTAAAIREARNAFVTFRPETTGSFGDHSIRSRLEDCAVGDVVPDDRAPTCVHSWVQIDPTTYRFTWPLANDCAEYAEFERLTQRLTSDNGTTWEEQRFWRRVR